MSRDKDRKIAVITGASAGIGRGVDGLEGAARDVREAGGEAMIIRTDVADQTQVEAAAQRVESEWGAIDVWVNDAMATIFCDAMSIAPEDFKRATEVTYLGTVWGAIAALKRMRPRNCGTVVQVGSALAYRSIPL